LTKFGITPSMIKSVFLTHSDYDHIGGIDTFKDADAYISENELAMIHHGKHRPFSYRSNSVQIMRLKPLHDKMVLNIDNVTVECIMTPGHTEGSMSYLVENKYIFAGDTCKISNDTIVPLKKYINMNTNDQIVSIKKLKKYKQIEMTFVGHTGFKVGF
jgi:glyoxylase-like metal-dependent hydrolase (beta-lactamase superfamily II)